MFKIARSLIVALSFCSAASLSFGQPTTAPAEVNDTPEAKEVKKALIDFVMLLEKPELTEVKEAFAGDAEAFKSVQDFFGAFKAGQRAKAAVERKFPEEAAKRNKSDDMTAKGLARDIQRDKVVINGDEATVGKMGTKLARENGQWKVVELIGDPMGKKLMGGMLPGITATMDEIAAEIEADKYKSMQEVEKAVQQKMAARMRAMLPAAADRPATQPAK